MTNFIGPRTANEQAVLEVAAAHGFDHMDTGGNCRAIYREANGHIQVITYDNTCTYDGPLASDGFALTQAHVNRWHCGENDFEAFGNVADLLKHADSHMAALSVSAFLRGLDSHTSLTRIYGDFLLHRGLPSMCAAELLYEFLADPEFMRHMPTRADTIAWLVTFNARWDNAIES